MTFDCPVGWPVVRAVFTQDRFPLHPLATLNLLVERVSQEVSQVALILTLEDPSKLLITGMNFLSAYLNSR